MHTSAVEEVEVVFCRGVYPECLRGQGSLARVYPQSVGDLSFMFISWGNNGTAN